MGIRSIFQSYKELNKLLDTMTPKEIAKKYKCGVSTVYGRMMTLGVEPRQRKTKRCYDWD